MPVVRHDPPFKFVTLLYIFLLLQFYTTFSTPYEVFHIDSDIEPNNKDPPPNKPISNESTTSNLTIETMASRAWSTPNSSEPSRAPLYSTEVLSRLVRRYHERVTTNDPINEDYYTYKRLGDNVWFNIERVARFKMFMRWMVNTSRVTDRFENGSFHISKYISKVDVACAPESAFSIPADVILSDDKSKRIALDSKINQWLTTNRKTPVDKMCNRFRGLTCLSGTCQCEGGGSGDTQYIAYSRTTADNPIEYPNGCYTKPWKKCRHLSLDKNILAEYKSYHAHRTNMKQLLMRMATPLPATPRCERGTYCVDMILNQHHPICWCNSRSLNKECFKVNSTIPMLPQFFELRKHFHQMIIHERDQKTKCTVDQERDEMLEAIKRFLEEVDVNFYIILKTMKQVIRKGGKFCDFRKGMACDPYKNTCTFKNGCGAGRVEDTKKICRINNGYPCPALELTCVNGADCKDFGEGAHCHCGKGKYGDYCRLQNPTFFASLLYSRVSGFVGYHFVNMQEILNNVLTPLERLMTVGFNQSCNPNLDHYAMRIVKQLGNLKLVNLDQMDYAMGSAQYLVGKDEPICDYRKFLRCTVSAICEPIMPDVAQYGAKPAPEVPGGTRVILRLQPRARCGGNNSYIMQIFKDVVQVQCLPGYECRPDGDGANPLEKLCLCPIGFQGINCKEKVVYGSGQQANMFDIPNPVNNARSGGEQVVAHSGKRRMTRCVRKYRHTFLCFNKK